MNWNELSMAQKSELMSIYVRNGITSLDAMSKHFNTYANGGPKKTYKEWAIQMHTKYPWLELDPNKAGYDYERYFNENYDDAVARLNEAEARHFTDKYKLSNHPTFSNESLYSQGPRYGGTWTKDNKFVPSVINQQQYPNVYNQNRTYTEEEIYDRLRHKFDEGGPKQNRYVAPRFPEEYQVLPVNEEGIPYYTLPDLEVTAEGLPQAKATDANIQRYANAVASGQLKLTQIPNTELRNRVRAKPIVDQIIRDRDKILAPILMGTVGMPAAIIGGISAAPTAAAIMNNPIVDAGLTIHGAVTAPRNIIEGVQEIREGEYGRGVLDLGLIALDLYGAGKLVKHSHNAAKRLAKSSITEVPITEVPIITKENLSTITDAQWDDAYRAAINNGDMEEVQRLRDLHFIKSTPGNKLIQNENMPLRNYHGTDSEPFNEFDLKKFGKHDQGDRGFGFYFSRNKNVAKEYGNRVEDYYLYATNPYNGEEEFSRYLNRTADPNELIRKRYGPIIEEQVKNIKEAIENGEDLSSTWTKLGINKTTSKEDIESILYKAYKEDFIGNLETADSYISDYENVIYNPNRIKKADAITYDDAGNIIPLSKRDNFKLNDVRYALTPLIIGAGIGNKLQDKDVKSK